MTVVRLQLWPWLQAAITGGSLAVRSLDTVFAPLVLSLVEGQLQARSACVLVSFLIREYVLDYLTPNSHTRRSHCLPCIRRHLPVRSHLPRVDHRRLSKSQHSTAHLRIHIKTHNATRSISVVIWVFACNFSMYELRAEF